MTQSMPALAEIMSKIKIDDQGWNIAIFEDKNAMSRDLCGYCDSVCCNAVELGCNHLYEEIYLYCKDCLTKLIQGNNGKCPINSHHSPIMIAVRSVRRRILQSITVCPYSEKYKNKQPNKYINYKNNIHSQIIDTAHKESKTEAEGIYDNYNDNDSKENIDGCKWTGTLNDLITKHLATCILKYDISFFSLKIQKLEEENQTLKETIKTQNKTLIKQSDTLNQNLSTIYTLKQQNKALINKLKEQMLIVNNLQSNIDAKKIDNNKQISMNENESKLNDVSCDANVAEKKIIFHFNKENVDLFKISNDEKTITWKGKYFSDPTWVLCGDLCKENDEITVYFEIPTIGNNVCYGFGFISKDFSQWINGYNEIKNGIIINGLGVVYSSDEFSKYQNPKRLGKFKHLFDMSLQKNVIAISINMKENIGSIWNENKKENVFKSTLPQTAGIVLSFAGNETKKASILKHTWPV